jgi:hypothetical protein
MHDFSFQQRRNNLRQRPNHNHSDADVVPNAQLALLLFRIRSSKPSRLLRMHDCQNRPNPSAPIPDCDHTTPQVSPSAPMAAPALLWVKAGACARPSRERCDRARWKDSTPTTVARGDHSQGAHCAVARRAGRTGDRLGADALTKGEARFRRAFFVRRKINLSIRGRRPVLNPGVYVRERTHMDWGGGPPLMGPGFQVSTDGSARSGVVAVIV